MPARPFSLRRRLTLALTVLILAVFGSAALLVDQAVDRTMQQRFDATLLVRANTAAALLADAYAEADNDGGAPRALGEDASWYQLRCGQHRLAGTMQRPAANAPPDAPTFTNATLADRTAVRTVAMRWTFPRSANAPPAPCTLDYAMPVAGFHAMLRDIDLILLGSLLLACLLVVLATPWVGGRALRPLTALTRVMAHIGPDTPGARLPASHTAELAPLTNRFNEVLARMDAGLARERRFAAGVAHEFRTRLAELRVLVEVETRYPSGRDAAALLAEVGHICAELEATVTALLQLTRIQAGLEQARIEPVPLASSIERVVARHLPAANARGLTLDIAPADPATLVDADPTLLEVVLDNLLGNAIAYATAGDHIALHAGPASWTVCNAAPLLQPADVPQLGQQFWRKSPAGSGHAGLGIALATAAANAMHMRLAFTLADDRLCARLAWGDEQTAGQPQTPR